MNKITIIIILLLSSTAMLSQTKWQRSEPIQEHVSIFRSIEALSLPTSETMQSGDIYFHISHKFLIPVSEGAEELFGFDGGINMRLALGYGITDDIFASLGRTNLDGNIDLQVRAKVFEGRVIDIPLGISINGALAYNSKVSIEPEDNSRLWQYYAQVIANTKIGKLGLGVVPSFLYNSNMYCSECQYTWTLGLYSQYFFNERWSIIAEANPTLNGWRQYYDTYSIGAEVETAGHFFKVFLSNNVYTNMSQFLGGARDAFDKGDIHIGFIITRVL
ncbi:MAG: DUF5777 family beta-barrel protein [Candidatus Kapaibacterium sp.]|jgi:hypothetical protein|nr:DUF5777 family beta-barrel protein [Candidatus Kapabacteria bacterium]